ncbi:DUF4878 domain-containing protein [Mycobacterium talmoniae]|uniref:Uncharacterized protein n=1 Tax=Mycobacterium talmoniae TaxID=1858794 RepID=A0A1S1NM54_9MYCO|nr:MULTISPECIES: DUF4878 domain-containing protein [Mycobacterium]OHV05764.1 hypothetical protein BKN37_04695 [Mycobacterium talmoniae]PQM45757.1 hypothetical protein C1Y40_04074 [Mycobacterium talmoniae]
MTEGPGSQFGGNPNPGEGWASPNAPWSGGQAQPGQPAAGYPYGGGYEPAYQQPVWSPTGGPQPYGELGVPPQPPRNRKPLIIWGSVGGAVLLVIIVVISVVAFSGGSDSGTAGEVVKAYLEALAKGDADKALSYSTDQPASKELLTDEILQKQIDKWPITDIKILGDDATYGYGRVHVSAKFGDQTSDETISVKKSNKKWRLEHAAIKLDTSRSSVNNEAMKTLTAFGKSLSESPVYVFPGWVDLGSENPNLTVNVKKPLLLNDLGLSGEAYLDIDFAVSDKGNKAISSAIMTALQKCTASNQLSPPDCPQRVYKYELVDGTAAWGTPDISGLKLEASGYDLQARINGQIVFPLTARTRSGDTWNGTVTQPIYGKADLSKDPPTVDLS